MKLPIVFNLQLFKFFEPLQDQRMVGLVAETAKGQHRIDHRRKNRPQAIGVLQAGNHPLLRLFDGKTSKRFDPGSLEFFKHQVNRRKDLAPAEDRLGIPVKTGSVSFGPGRLQTAVASTRDRISIFPVK